MRRVDSDKFIAAAMEEPPKITIKINTLQAGILQSLLWQDHKAPMKPIFEQLRVHELKMKRRARVSIEVLEGGLLGLTDRDGNRIVRDAFPWELKDW